MKTVKISLFKVRCIGILKNVARKGEPVVVTLRGKPLARIEPIAERKEPRVLGGLKGSLEIHGDIVRSDFADDWEDPDRGR